MHTTISRSLIVGFALVGALLGAAAVATPGAAETHAYCNAGSGSHLGDCHFGGPVVWNPSCDSGPTLDITCTNMPA